MAADAIRAHVVRGRLHSPSDSSSFMASLDNEEIASISRSNRSMELKDVDDHDIPTVTSHHLEPLSETDVVAVASPASSGGKSSAGSPQHSHAPIEAGSTARTSATAGLKHTLTSWRSPARTPNRTLHEKLEIPSEAVTAASQCSSHDADSTGKVSWNSGSSSRCTDTTLPPSPVKMSSSLRLALLSTQESSTGSDCSSLLHTRRSHVVDWMSPQAKPEESDPTTQPTEPSLAKPLASHTAGATLISSALAIRTDIPPLRINEVMMGTYDGDAPSGSVTAHQGPPKATPASRICGCVLLPGDEHVLYAFGKQFRVWHATTPSVLTTRAHSRRMVGLAQLRTRCEETGMTRFVTVDDRGLVKAWLCYSIPETNGAEYSWRLACTGEVHTHTGTEAMDCSIVAISAAEATNPVAAQLGMAVCVGLLLSDGRVLMHQLFMTGGVFGSLTDHDNGGPLGVWASRRALTVHHFGQSRLAADDEDDDSCGLIGFHRGRSASVPGLREAENSDASLRGPTCLALACQYAALSHPVTRGDKQSTTNSKPSRAALAARAAELAARPAVEWIGNVFDPATHDLLFRSRCAIAIGAKDGTLYRGEISRRDSHSQSSLYLGASTDPCQLAVHRRAVLHTEQVNCVAFHPSKPFIASAAGDGLVGLWHMADMAPATIVGTSEYPQYCCAFNTSGSVLVTCGAGPMAVAWITDSSSRFCFSLTEPEASVHLAMSHRPIFAVVGLSNQVQVCDVRDAESSSADDPGEMLKRWTRSTSHMSSLPRCASADFACRRYTSSKRSPMSQLSSIRKLHSSPLSQCSVDKHHASPQCHVADATLSAGTSTAVSTLMRTRASQE